MPNTKKPKRSRTYRFKRMGFDLTVKIRNGHYRIRCSQCQALVINGTPCHETGCPNQK